MELIDLVNSVIIFLSQITLVRWPLLESLTVTVTVLLFWISFFWRYYLFYNDWLSLHWQIVIVLLCQFPWTFCQTENGMPYFIAHPETILMLIRMVFVIIWDMFCKKIILNSMLLLLLVNFMIGSRLELMCISLIVSIRSGLTHLHGFQQLALLP